MTGVWLIWRHVTAYAAHDDSLAAACNRIALIIAANQPFYPLYVYWAVGADVWPTFLTFLSTPLFLLVPALTRQHPLLGRAALPLIGIANMILSAKAFGQASGVEIFLMPCVVIAALFFRASERLVAFALVALCLAVFLVLHGRYGVPLHTYSPSEYASFLRLNAVSAGMLTALIGFIAAELIERVR